MANKFFAASALALCVMGGLNMAHAQDGTVTFTGSITDNTCTIATDSKDITVDFGQVSDKAYGDSVKNFDINLTGCPATVTTATVTVNAEASVGSTGSPVTIRDYVDGVGVTDPSNSYWKIFSGYDKSSASYLADGSNSKDYTLTAGNNALPQSAEFYSSKGAAIGTHTGEATYTITYQ